MFYTGAFCAMAAAVGLLITPSMEHLIVERGRSTARLLRVTTCFAGLALLPMGLSLGTDLSIVLTYRFGAAAGVTVGLVASGLALVLWYGAEFLLRKSDKGKPVMDEGTSIDVRIEHMLTEARVLLPGERRRFSQHMLDADIKMDVPSSVTGLPLSDLRRRNSAPQPKNECKSRGYQAHGEGSSRAKWIGLRTIKRSVPQQSHWQQC